MSHEENWTYGIIEEDKPKLQPLLDTLRRLWLCRLTAGMVAAVFHRRRLLPLMQRWLWIDEMTPEASLEGSQMSHESLPLDEVTRRARWMVGELQIGGHRQGSRSALPKDSLGFYAGSISGQGVMATSSGGSGCSRG
jgi:hypothetical protein